MNVRNMDGRRCGGDDVEPSSEPAAGELVRQPLLTGVWADAFANSDKVDTLFVSAGGEKGPSRRGVERRGERGDVTAGERGERRVAPADINAGAVDVVVVGAGIVAAFREGMVEAGSELEGTGLGAAVADSAI